MYITSDPREAEILGVKHTVIMRVKPIARHIRQALNGHPFPEGTLYHCNTPKQKHLKTRRKK